MNKVTCPICNAKLKPKYAVNHKQKHVKEVKE